MGLARLREALLPSRVCEEMPRFPAYGRLAFFLEGTLTDRFFFALTLATNALTIADARGHEG